MSKIQKIAVINATTGVAIYLEDGSQVNLGIGDDFSVPAPEVTEAAEAAPVDTSAPAEASSVESAPAATTEATTEA